MQNHDSQQADRKRRTDGSTVSLWSADTKMPYCPVLEEDLTVDVCIVGAGLGGITTAYLLQKEGKKVCVLESLEIGAGQTGRTTAQFSTALDDRYFDLEKYHGHEGAKIAAGSHQAAINLVATIVKDEAIECDFKSVPGYLFRHPESEKDILERELEAAHRAGLDSLYLTNLAAPSAFLKGDAICFPDQVQLHPLKYLKALSEIVVRRGGLIRTQTRVIEITGGKKAGVKTADGFTVTADAVVVATNSPINDLFAIHTKQAPYRTYVLTFEIEEGAVDEAFYWDTSDPYHYVRLQGNLLIVGGEDHKTGQEDHPEKCFEKLEAWTRNHFADAGRVTQRWSGQVMEPVDGLAYLGHNPLDKNNIYVITGDSGNGMTHCTIGSLLITDQIMGRENSWEKLYQPNRKSLRAGKEFLKENLNVAAQYVDWAKPHHSLADADKLKAGEGCLVRNGATILAVSKESSGTLTKVSAICSHLGALVQWNQVEKTWDCPCHGSRFARTGEVLEGPAIAGLKQL